jgi:aspartyl-tRNA(Asn)/glutamyl-tRNA(Gln) amidotransferase subunit C
MTQLTAAQVRHIAKLARLELSDAEVAKFTTELTSILQYVDMLTEVDTKGVEATEQVTGQANSLREDVIRAPQLAEPDALLATSPLPIEDHQIRTPSAHG